MGKIIGVGATKAPKTYTEKDVTKLTKKLNDKIINLEVELNNANEIINTLNTEKSNLETKVKELEDNIANLNKNNE